MYLLFYVKFLNVLPLSLFMSKILFYSNIVYTKILYCFDVAVHTHLVLE